MVALFSGAATLTGAIAAAPVATAIAGAALAGSVIYVAYRSIPPKSFKAAQLLGKQLSLEDLTSLDQNLIRVVVVGASQSGKSTFFLKAQQLSKNSSRTNTVQAEILMLPGNPPQYVALLDADGKEFVQQFEILKDADFLILFVDHSISATDPSKSADRLADHDRFIEQVEPVIRRGRQLPKLHLLFNKRDLWENSAEAPELLQWFDNHVADWRRINIASDLTFSAHSNNHTNDMANIMEMIRNFVSSRTTP